MDVLGRGFNSIKRRLEIEREGIFCVENFERVYLFRVGSEREKR